MRVVYQTAALVAIIAISSCCADSTEADNLFSANIDNAVQANGGSLLEESLIRKLNVKCSQRDVSSCLMLKLVTYMNRMLKKAAIQIGDDVEITQNSTAVETVKPDEVVARAGDSEDDQLAQLLMNKVSTFVRTRSLKWKMFDDAELIVSNTPDADGSMNIGMAIKSAGTNGDGRGKMKNLAPFIAAAAMKLGLLGGLAFKALALLVGKALLVSKIALLLSSIIGLKKLFSHQKHVTYEVVSHPHHHESSGHDTYSSGFGRESGRSDNVAQELAYSAQKPEEPIDEIDSFIDEILAESPKVPEKPE